MSIKIKYKDKQGKLVPVDLNIPKNRVVLQETYNLASSLPDRFFLIGVFEYMGLFDRKDLFFFIIQKIVIKQSKIDNELLNSIREKALVEIKETYGVIKKAIYDNRETDQLVCETTDMINDLMSGRAIALGDLQSLDTNLYSLLYRLVELREYSNTLSNFGVFKKDGSLSHWTFDRNLKEYYDERDRLSRLKWISVWFYWTELAMVENIYKHIERYRKELTASNQMFRLAGYNDIYREITNILEDKKPEQTEYHNYISIRDYREYLRILNYYILRIVDEELISPSIVESTEGVEVALSKDVAVQQNINEKISKAKPFCIVENGKGYLKLYKQGEKKLVARPSTATYKLLDYLTENCDNYMDFKLVYKQMKIPKFEKQLQKIVGYASEQAFMVKKIEYTIKYMQKLRPLKGLISIEWDDRHTGLRLRKISS